jgi:hypothetical protein
LGAVYVIGILLVLVGVFLLFFLVRVQRSPLQLVVDCQSDLVFEFRFLFFY